MKKTIYVLSVIIFLLAVWAMTLWLPIGTASHADEQETRYGLNEGLELVEQATGKDGKRYVVEDADGKELFVIPLRNCLLDTRYRNGQLRFREQFSHREGFIDRQGMVTFINDGNASIHEGNKNIKQDVSPNEYLTQNTSDKKIPPQTASDKESLPQTGSGKESLLLMTSGRASRSKVLSQVDLRTMAQSNPFYKEAAKIMQGKLSESDAKRRHTILNYCEHFRTAYTTKDIDFLRQVFSDKALIIVGNVVKTAANDNKIQAESKVTYAIHSKHDYINRLSKVFATNQKIDVKFSGFRILRHPTMDGIYGVTLRQQYKSDRYSDDGYLFLLWDFRDKSMPLIHVRTWQPTSTVGGSGDIINIQDFNLQ